MGEVHFNLAPNIPKPPGRPKTSKPNSKPPTGKGKRRPKRYYSLLKLPVTNPRPILI